MRNYYRYKESHRTVRGVKQKRCTICEKWKPESNFHKDRARKDGLKSRCKDCERVYQRELAGRDGRNIKEYLKFAERHRTFRGVRQKLCSLCEKWIDESHFQRSHKVRDGLEPRCKECKNRRARERYKRKRLADPVV